MEYNFRIMRKRLAILAWLVIIGVAYGQEKAAHPKGNQTEAYDLQDSQAKPSPVGGIVSITEVHQEASADKSDGSNKAPEGFISRHIPPEKVTNFGLFIVGLSGIVIAVCTLLKLERQIKAAQDATEAALLNTKAMIGSERAWIVIEVQEFNQMPGRILHFKAKNVGRTPARVISIHGKVFPIRSPYDKPQKIGWDELNESLLSTPPCLLPATASCLVFRFDLNTDFVDLDTVSDEEKSPEILTHFQKLGFSEIIFYGKVRYYDTLEPEPKTLRETKWRYWTLTSFNAPVIPDTHHPEDNSYS